MKLMKHITIALVLCAIPAVAVGQTVSCDDCTHVASVYMGEGGVIATADGSDMVTWVASCGGVTRSGELTADADGVVSALWAGDLACMAEGGGSFEIGPVMDGGWFWITDADNSAVGGLVAKNVLDNAAADITSAGMGVSMTKGKGAVYLKEAATGRVGILPNILPEAPMEALRKCGFDSRGEGSHTANANVSGARYTRRTSECAMGDGGAIVVATVYNSQTGATTRVMDEATIVRPGGTGTTVITVDLWGNGSGHVVTSTSGYAPLGNPALALTSLRSLARLDGVTYTATLGGGPTADSFTSGTALGGITMDTGTADVVTFTIGRDSAYCNASPARNNPATVSVTAAMGIAANTTRTTTVTQVTPSIAVNPRNVYDPQGEQEDPADPSDDLASIGSTSFTVVCAGSSSSSSSSSPHQGRELVPENLFSTN